MLDGELAERELKADGVLQVVKDIQRWGFFDAAQDLGIHFGPNDLSFADFILFREIKSQRKK